MKLVTSRDYMNKEFFKKMLLEYLGLKENYKYSEFTLEQKYKMYDLLQTIQDDVLKRNPQMSDIFFFTF